MVNTFTVAGPVINVENEVVTITVSTDGENVMNVNTTPPKEVLNKINEERNKGCPILSLEGILIPADNGAFGIMIQKYGLSTISKQNLAWGILWV